MIYIWSVSTNQSADTTKNITKYPIRENIKKSTFNTKTQELYKINQQNARQLINIYGQKDISLQKLCAEIFDTNNTIIWNCKFKVITK